MKISLFLVALSIFVVITNAQADLIEKKPVIIPPEMQNIVDAAGLATYLNNPDSDTRETAVMRLGEIGGTDAIDLLMKFFNQEPESMALEVQRGVKEAVVTALGKIGTEEAKQNLLAILLNYIKNGKTIDYGASYRYVGQASAVIRCSLEALSNFTDADVIDTLETITKDQSIPSGCYVPELATGSLLKIKMKQEGITTTDAQIDYLVNNLTGSGSEPGAWAGQGIRTTEGLKNGAIEGLLEHMGEETLPYFKVKINQIPKEDVRRYKALSGVIKSLEAIKISRDYSKKMKARVSTVP